MPDAPAYTTVPGKLPELLKKIRETGVPAKANNSWLESLGYRSSNDRSMLGVLRQIGFVDGAGTPTPAWKEYRGGDSKGVLGRAIRVGYEDLYATYEDADTRSNTDLGHLFTTRTDAGKQSVDKMVSTFKTLAGQAEFQPGIVPSLPASGVATPQPLGGALAVTGAPTGMSVNINIGLTLPETTDEKVYEAFFRAMRKHLLSDDSA